MHQLLEVLSRDADGWRRLKLGQPCQVRLGSAGWSCASLVKSDWEALVEAAQPKNIWHNLCWGHSSGADWSCAMLKNKFPSLHRGRNNHRQTNSFKTAILWYLVCKSATVGSKSRLGLVFLPRYTSFKCLWGIGERLWSTDTPSRWCVRVSDTSRIPTCVRHQYDTCLTHDFTCPI